MEDYKKKYEEALERVKRCHKYIKNALVWNKHIGPFGAWVRISDLNFVTTETGSYWFPAQTGHPTYRFRDAFPYEDWMEEYVGTNRTKELLERIFGLTNESEDEKIRKELIRAFTVTADKKSHEIYGNGITYGQVLAWLEKQVEQKPADKVEPKFHKGDWVIYEIGEYSATLQIKNIVDGTYEFTDNSTLNVVDKNTLRLWTIQDAKDGDVLCYENEVFILKNYVLFHKIVYHCCYDGENFIPHSIYSLTKDDFNKIHPATKKQCDLLFSKMKKAGYEWDNEKKELRKIEQNPAWSEEDEKVLNTVIIKGDLKPSEIYWLKSLKERMKGE